MRPINSFIHRYTPKYPQKGTSIILSVAVLLAGGLTGSVVAGCGSSSSSDGAETGTSTGPAVYAANVTHPAPGKIEVVDSKGDIHASQSDLTQVPSFTDIGWVDIAKAGDNYIFSTEVGGLLPDTPQSGKVLQWGFIIDTNQDGQPDWSVSSALELKDGWYPLVTNELTKEKFDGAKFPGTFTHTGTTLVWTVPAAAIGSPTGFKWFAFSNYYAKGSDGQTRQASDIVPENGEPDKSDNWLAYP